MYTVGCTSSGLPPYSLGSKYYAFFDILINVNVTSRPIAQPTRTEEGSRLRILRIPHFEPSASRLGNIQIHKYYLGITACI